MISSKTVQNNESLEMKECSPILNTHYPRNVMLKHQRSGVNTASIQPTYIYEPQTAMCVKLYSGTLFPGSHIAPADGVHITLPIAFHRLTM